MQIWLCQKCVQDRQNIVKNVLEAEDEHSRNLWIYRLSKLCQLCLQLILHSSPNENGNPALRILEIFTSCSTFERDGTSSHSDIVTRIFRFLIHRRYFECLRTLCDSRIPPLIEATPKPPTPIAEIILDLISRPLKLLNQTDQNFRSEMVQRLGSAFFQTEFSEQVRNFILPALSGTNFPYLDWISVLNREENLANPWLLFSFLSLGRLNLEVFSPMEVIQYLNVLSKLSVSISKGSNYAKIQIDDDPEESDDDDEDDHNADGSPISSEERECLQSSLSLLNSTEVVSNLIAATEKCAKEPLALKLLCRICHNLLLADKAAIHKFRLLNTLAFRSALIHRLWNLILDAKQPSAIGKPVPLLTVSIKRKRSSSSIANDVGLINICDF